MTELKRFGELSHGGPTSARMTFYRQKELMLLRGDSGGARRGFYEAEVFAERFAKIGESQEIFLPNHSI